MTEPTFPVMPRYPRTAYINPPKEIARRSPSGQRGWHVGWPDDCTPKAERKSFQVTRPSDGSVMTFELDARLADLYQEFLSIIQVYGPELRRVDEKSANGKRQGGNGDFACRNIAGTDSPSNHSSATAMDLWTSSNPKIWRKGEKVPFVSTIHPETVELAGAALLYWGGWYWDRGNTYVDSMHFEFMARPEDVGRAHSQLKAKWEEIKKRHAPPPEEPKPVKPEDVKLLQIALNQAGTTPPLVVDGIYGPVTKAAVIGLPGLVASQVTAAEKAGSAEMQNEAVAAVQSIPVV